VIDTHAHLDACREPADALIAEAAEAGVGRILTVGREQAVELAERFGGVWAIAGVHPHEAGEFADAAAAIRPLAAHPRVVAVGECGLDYYRDHAPRDAQRRAFEAQIGLSEETGLPLVIHTREADDDTFAMLAGVRATVVLHCFSSAGRLDDALDRGYYLSFAGNVCYPAAGALRDAARGVPADRLLAETDSPYLAPPPHRGRPNRPALVVHTLALLAGERGTDPETVAAQIDRNAERVFGLPPA
jgi:TatD DNase family protein